jgi:hypothetical protein
MAVLVGLPRRAPETSSETASGTASATSSEASGDAIARSDIHAPRPTGDLALAPIRSVLTRAGAEHAARIRVTHLGGRGSATLVQVNLRCNGAPARVQVAGRTAAAAVDAASARLSRQLRRLTNAYEPWPWPDPQRRALALPDPTDIVRRKPYRLLVGVPCQAAAFMNAMDYDVMLYTDAETGEDAVVYRCGPTGLRLARQRSMHPPKLPVLLPLTVNAHKVPTFTEREAAAHLAHGWLPYVFYTDRTTSRGHLLYRRYDGNLGLIAPR